MIFHEFHCININMFVHVVLPLGPLGEPPNIRASQNLENLYAYLAVLVSHKGLWTPIAFIDTPSLSCSCL